MERTATPPLLPIFRSQQQAELLARLLGEPDTELTLTELAQLTDVPYPSVHREIERAEAAGLVRSRRIGRSRLVAADTTSPYFPGLADVLVKAFGPPHLLARALAEVDGIEAAYLYGSWAARHAGQNGDRPVGDLDLLVLGDPDRDALYAELSKAETTLGRPVQVTIRPPGWLENGSGSFHATVTSRPLVPVPVPASATRTEEADSSR